MRLKHEERTRRFAILVLGLCMSEVRDGTERAARGITCLRGDCSGGSVHENDKSGGNAMGMRCGGQLSTALFILLSLHPCRAGLF